MRDRNAGLPGEDLAELDELAVERGVERRSRGPASSGHAAACAGVWALLMSSNHGREASVSINPGQSAMISLFSREVSRAALAGERAHGRDLGDLGREC